MLIDYNFLFGVAFTVTDVAYTAASVSHHLLIVLFFYFLILLFSSLSLLTVLLLPAPCQLYCS